MTKQPTAPKRAPKASAQQRMTLSLTPSSRDILQRTGSPSAYVSNVVRARWLAWQQAFGALMWGNWQAQDVSLAVQALNGASDIQVGAVEAASAILAGLKGLDSKRRKATQDDVRHLLTLAGEFWAGNEEVREMIRSGGRHQATA